METDRKPVTLHTIKRRATQLKKKTGLPHHQALDKIAAECGYNNYRDAHRQLSEKA